MRRLRPGTLPPPAADVVLAVLFTALYFTPLNTGAASLAALTAFKAPTPYQYRVLLPLLARGVEAVAPVDLTLLYAVFVAGFTCGLLVVFRRYLQFFVPPAVTPFSALFLFYQLWWNYCQVSDFRYVWDIPTIFFFTLSLVLIRQQRWRLLLITFLLASLNRETSIFITCAFVLTQFGTMPWRRLAALTTLQLAIWTAIKLALTRWFLANPGEKLHEPHIRANLTYLLDTVRQPADSTLWVFMTFGWMVLLMAITWRRQPEFFRRLLLVTGPFLVVMSFMSDFSRVRMFNEMVPILLAPALLGLETLRQAVARREAAKGPSQAS